jgi:hypothetical protein
MAVTDRAFDEAMARWNLLRAQLKQATAAKAHTDVVRICDDILAFSAANPAISVVDWLFDKRAAKALADQGCFSDARARSERAIVGCKRHQATVRLAKPDEFVADLASMETLHDRWRKKAGGS